MMFVESILSKTHLLGELAIWRRILKSMNLIWEWLLAKEGQLAWIMLGLKEDCNLGEDLVAKEVPLIVLYHLLEWQQVAILEDSSKDQLLFSQYVRH